jgi:TDG/mug DNA glycosylase family protein
MIVYRPSRQEVAAAVGKTVPDVIAPGLKVLFCGINPGLYSGATGHHFARPGNRFWPTLYGAGFTPRLLSPFEERELLDYSLGITNLVGRATATADQLAREELIAGGQALAEKVAVDRPHVLAVLGISAYRRAFGRPHAVLGPQNEGLAGSRLWVLPNPSGLNAHHGLDDLVQRYLTLRQAVAEGV